MEKKKAGGGPSPRGPDRKVVVILLGAQIIVALAIWMLVRSRSSFSAALHAERATDIEGLRHERQLLQRKLDDWKRRALAAGLKDVDSDQASGRASGVAVATATGGGSGGAIGGGKQDSSLCTPNGHPITTVAPVAPQYLMRPAAEVEAENPEFAALLKQHANDKQEIMLALTNAVMICQNTTLCWWNGGNILGSFLEILERSNITVMPGNQGRPG